MGLCHVSLWYSSVFNLQKWQFHLVQSETYQWHLCIFVEKPLKICLQMVYINSKQESYYFFCLTAIIWHSNDQRHLLSLIQRRQPYQAQHLLHAASSRCKTQAEQMHQTTFTFPLPVNVYDAHGTRRLSSLFCKLLPYRVNIGNMGPKDVNI